MDKIWYESYPEGVPREIEPDQYESLVDFFEDCCDKYREKNAVSNLGVTLTYDELDAKTRDFAAYLQEELRLNKGDRIALMLPNTIQYYIALFGALRAGLVVVNVNPLYTPRELEHQLSDAGVETIIVLANFAHTVEKALGKVRLKNIIITKLGDLCSFPKAQIVNFVVKYIKRIVPSYNLPGAISFKQALNRGAKHELRHVPMDSSDLAFLQYTGGTTGVAKGAMLTHRNIVANILQAEAWTGPKLDRGKEVAVLPLPLYHIFSLTGGCFVMMALGAEAVLITNPRDLNHFVKKLKKTKFTTFMSINTLCNALLNHPEFESIDFSHLKITITGGMSTSEDVARRWHEATGVHITEGYGLTETSPIVTINSFYADSFTGGIGLPMPSTDIRVIDEEGDPLPIGEVGELCVNGPQVMDGYWKKPEEDKKVFTEDGWFKTGDMVKMERDGLIKLVDRKKDMIIVSGFNVYPNEVENVLMSHPGVLEAAVIGVPDKAKGGEKVKAIIVKKDPDLTEDALIYYCRGELTPYKVPHIIEFENELPKTPVGKILRRKLREAEEEEAEALKEAA